MSKEFKKAFAHMVLPLTMLIVILVMSIAGTKAWFASNHTVSAKGMTVSTDCGEITIGDTIKVVKTRGQKSKTYIYKEDATSNSYYLYDDVKNQYILSPSNKKIPINIADLLPGETVDLVFSYTCSDNLIGKNIKVDLINLRSDLFDEPAETNQPQVQHSIFGVFKAAIKTDSQEPPIELGYLQTWQKGVSDSGPSKFNLISINPWEKPSGQSAFKEFTLRLQVDFEPLNALSVATNELSEKTFTVGTLKVSVGND